VQHTALHPAAPEKCPRRNRRRQKNARASSGSARKCLRCMQQRPKIKLLWLAPDRKRR